MTILAKLSRKNAILHEENWGKWFKKMCPTKWPQFEIRLKECDRNSYMKKLIFKVTCDLKKRSNML